MNVKYKSMNFSIILFGTYLTKIYTDYKFSNNSGGFIEKSNIKKGFNTERIFNQEIDSNNISNFFYIINKIYIITMKNIIPNLMNFEVSGFIF
jgi:hypothetical protein